eukprot:scaffold4.g4764.t1
MAQGAGQSAAPEAGDAAGAQGGPIVTVAEAPRAPAADQHRGGATSPCAPQGQQQGPSGSYTTPGGELGSGTGSDEQQAAASQPGQHLSQSAGTMSPQQLLLLQQQMDAYARPKRNARQQEQNKMAQQRYRAKRKAQFEDLQSKVEMLQAEVEASRKDRVEAERLRHEVALLRSKLLANAAPLAASAAAAGMSPVPGSLDPLDDLLAAATKGASAGATPSAPRTAAQGGAEASEPLRPAAVRSAPLVGSGGSFRPLPNAAATAALPVASAGTAATAASPPAPPDGSPGLALSPSPQQLRTALVLYYQELQAFAATALADPADTQGTGASPQLERRLEQLVQTGVELVKLVLHSKGPGAAQLLEGGAMDGGSACAPPAAADSLAQWREVAARLALAPSQARAVLAWRDALLLRLDEIYGQRLVLKAQLVQDLAAHAAAGGGAPPAAPPQWAEALLLVAAAGAGYAGPAAAAVALAGQLAALQANLAQEREAVGAAVEVLLSAILTRVQAAHFLLAGHPFCWNGLAFAHAVASLQQG